MFVAGFNSWHCIMPKLLWVQLKVELNYTVSLDLASRPPYNSFMLSMWLGEFSCQQERIDLMDPTCSVLWLAKRLTCYLGTELTPTCVSSQLLSRLITVLK